MEKLSKIACYFRWNKKDKITTKVEESPSRKNDTSPAEENLLSDEETNFVMSTRFFNILESILLWENSLISILVVIAFNILFWGVVVLEIRGFAAASSAALVVVLCYSTLEAQVRRNTKCSELSLKPRRVVQFEKILRKAKSIVATLKCIREDDPTLFLFAVGAFSICLILLGNAVNGVLLTYVICMSIFIVPALILQVPCKVFSPQELCNEYSIEWENEIEEFLPAATEDNLEVLQRAGDSGEHSPTSRSVLSEHQIDPFNEDELIGLRMPSHEDGSTDGLDVSELELSTGETEVDAIKIKSEHFEGGSSSEEDADLEPMSRKLPSASDESDSEFEIIDGDEIDNLRDV